MNIKNIPTDEDFARARAAMEHDDRGLSEVCDTIKDRFAASGLHQFFILYSPRDNLFVCYLFFSNEDQQISSNKSGLILSIQTMVLEELERVGRGNKSELKVNFEIDNDENVQSEYGSDYYARLR